MTNNKQQTAVEWLFHKMLNEKHHITEWLDILKQAKQMDKEQRLQDMSKMQIISDVDFDGNVTFMFSPEQYYNKTYGGNK